MSYLDIVSGSELQTRRNLERAIEESIVLMEIIVAGEVFRGKG